MRADTCTHWTQALRRIFDCWGHFTGSLTIRLCGLGKQDEETYLLGGTKKEERYKLFKFHHFKTIHFNNSIYTCTLFHITIKLLHIDQIGCPILMLICYFFLKSLYTCIYVDCCDFALYCPYVFSYTDAWFQLYHHWEDKRGSRSIVFRSSRIPA